MSNVSFPSQPEGVPWPVDRWPVGQWSAADEVSGAGVDVAGAEAAIEELFGHGMAVPQGRGLSLALVVVHRGRIVCERYGTQPANAFHGERAITSETSLISWSMAKSITHALVGLLVDGGRVDVSSPVDVAEWRADGRRDITWSDLLRMRDGLAFVEDYVADNTGASRSDVIDMLFGEGASDVYAFARSRGLAHPPGSTWSYSSGTTNILCGLVGEVLGGRSGVERCLHERIFSALAMTSATATFDDAGTFVGSSYVHASARDFARFGYLYLRGGAFAGKRILSEHWVSRALRQHAVDPDNGHGYGEHWWTWNADGRTLAALGYEGQRTIVSFDRDLVVVHLGKWDTSAQPFLDRMLTRVVDAFPDLRPGGSESDRSSSGTAKNGECPAQ